MIPLAHAVRALFHPIELVAVAVHLKWAAKWANQTQQWCARCQQIGANLQGRIDNDKI